MNRVIVLAALAGTLALGMGSAASEAASQKKEEVKTITFRVTGMTCGGCESALRIAVKRLEGIQKVTASYKTGRAVVRFDPSRVTVKAIRAAIEKLGYRAEPQKKEKKDSDRE